MLAKRRLKRVPVRVPCQSHIPGAQKKKKTKKTATLSSTIITQLAAAKQVSTPLASPVTVDDTPKGGIAEHDARSA
jgi:hypothetical protein